VFSDEEHARDLLLNALPNKILRVLEPAPLEISRESYIDEGLAEHQSDLLIRTRYRDHPVFVNFLVEHKSYPYRWTILQLLRYMVRIWEKELAQNKALKILPSIIPMIFYHGTRRWKQPLEFSSYVELQEGLRPYIPDFQVVLFNLA
jgi:predicted transposase/invertase (TIGR01784 family)